MQNLSSQASKLCEEIEVISRQIDDNPLSRIRARGKILA